MIRFDGGLALLGPTPGDVCVDCAESARRATLGPLVPQSDLTISGFPTPALKPFLELLATEVQAHADQYRRSVVAVRTDLGVVSHHPVRPRPGGCPVCGPIPDDHPQEPVLTAPVEPGQLRGANSRSGNLRAELFDLKHGPVSGVFRTGHLPLAVASAELVGASVEAGYGRTVNFEEAEQVALYEAVERYNGMRPRRTRTVLEASFTELGPDRALDPTRLGEYDAENHLTPYSPDLRIRWVHGWSYTHGKSVAVPEEVAYWAVGSRFIAETSNGCGLGNSLTEAVLHGLFEVAERDAFLMAWYGRTPLPRLPAHGTVLHLVDRLESIGYELTFFNATNDIGIPTVIGVARYQGSVPDTPQIFYAAGAHPDPRRAMFSAAVEVAVDVESIVDREAAEPQTYHRDRLRRLLAEPNLIRTMAEHVAVNALPEAADRHDFLLGQPEVEPPSADLPVFDNLKTLLDHYVDRLRTLDLEVIAVDQSDPVIAERLGLFSAKVIVPGTLPMTFGHIYRRTRGLSRLRANGPRLPHPFP
ncbi:ribosomal protein S12 methylthiotransferase accessory factor [Kibdelosporangium banguiense]|uniref:Ribosomal protein S12 methylthiotransferase accessory factor n=1 Tax=Kibdelosporangium banguiense TaxID=1365924 RepID=A0ABS4TI59_9PSEU|nr:YcaO-like family protein [Kibdelosporangium banguiense]MBP2324118.1 ribosomal protein S12 methylthiotransferase accessory factor [Kibdelosporangium banguiense]